jgi:hypothetical protein
MTQVFVLSAVAGVACLPAWLLSGVSPVLRLAIASPLYAAALFGLFLAGRVVQVAPLWRRGVALLRIP